MAEPRVRITTRAHGDFAPTGAPIALAQRRQAIAPHPWTWLRQMHGANVVTVTRPQEHVEAEADAAVTAVPGAVLSLYTADCAPVLLVAGTEAVGVVHAGWQGLMAGVVERAVSALTGLVNADVHATIGPCIRAGCYEFGPEVLDAVAGRYGDGVRATTMWGTPALDLPAAVAAALQAAGVATIVDQGACTACTRLWFSHRARAERERFAAVVWLEP